MLADRRTPAVFAPLASALAKRAGGRTLKILFSLLFCSQLAFAAPPEVLLMNISGAIGPAAADYFSAGLRRAQESGASLVVVEMDTPGGLDTAMRSIIHGILASPTPVAVYVAPKGARAASAGTYILYAAQIAAMAPGTNLGAATPVQLGGGILPAGDKAMEQKMVNDAAAYIRSLAAMNGRNAEWAEEAVRKAASLTAGEALAKKVIDLVEPDLPALLSALEGRQVKTASGEKMLHLTGAKIVSFAPNWRNRLFAALTSPDVAYILMVLGFYGLVFELANPGFGFPGVVGITCLLLAFFAFQSLPVNYAGVALILLSLFLFAAEAVAPTYGSLGFGGVVAFVVGSIFLVNAPAFAVSIPLVLAAALFSAFLVFALAAMALKTRRKKVVSGPETFAGSIVEAAEDFTGEGRVHLQGEIWSARVEGEVRRGEKLKVTGREGLVLRVEKLI